MDYEKKVAEALEELKRCDRYDTEPAKTILKLFPELEESDYVIKQRLRKYLEYFRCKGIDHNVCDRILKWLDKQGSTNIIPIPDECHAYIKDRKVYIESYTKTTVADKIEPKFQTGDTMRTLEEARDGFTSGMPMVISIDDEYYHCTNESIAIKDQDNYEYPPINRKEEKVKPKFKVNDWIVNKNGHAFLIEAVGDDKYLFAECGYTHEKLRWEFIKNADEHYALWSLEGAEDGEILVHNKYNTIDDFDYIFIYNKTSLLQAYGYYSKKKGRAFVEDRSHYCPWNMQEVKPATKEQRDILRTKLEEIHFKWDAKDKIFIQIDPWNYDPLDDYVNQ